MATEVISSRHLSAGLPEIPEDVSNGSSDVETLLLTGASEGKVNSASATGVVGSVVVPGSPRSADESSDKSGSGSPNVHHHHHYHYFYHHHFHHANGGVKRATAEVTTTKSSDRLMITSGSTSGEQSPVVQEPLTPNSPDTAVSQNTSALVRTISNGSTFGPINPSNWPLLFPGQSSTPSSTFSSSSSPSQSHSPVVSSHHHQSCTTRPASGVVSLKATTSSSISSSTANNNSKLDQPMVGLKRSNNSSSVPSSNSISRAGNSSTSGAILKRSKRSTLSPLSTPTLSSSSSSSSSSSPTTASSSSRIVATSPDVSPNTRTSSPVLVTAPLTPPATPTSSPVVGLVQSPTIPSSSPIAQQQLPSPAQPIVYATSSSREEPSGAVLAAICPPAQPNFQITLDLPLSFGDKYILTSQIEASNLYRCLQTDTMQEFCCKVVLSKDYTTFLAPHIRMDGHEGISQVKQIVVGRQHTFILFDTSYGDLHTYVRTKRRLREPEAMALFGQIAQIVADCHTNGIILRDLKLRKFIFSNKERTQLKLENLEGASVFEDNDDTLTDKHGCPAYVSPEILSSNAFSGTAADCWSLGVVLYTMLVGRYPFHDVNPSVVFCKIRRGTYYIPETLSKHAKCLIRSLIRIDPEQRLTAEDALAHQWLKVAKSMPNGGSSVKRSHHHHHHSLSAAAAAAINHHHFHHHHHHHSNSVAQSSATSATTTTTSSTPVNNQTQQPETSSFNDQSAVDASVQLASLSSRAPFLSAFRDNYNSSSARITFIPAAIPANPLTALRSSSSGSSGYGPAHHQHEQAGGMCSHHFASQCDQIVPDLSPANEDVDSEMMTD